jgi:hypothetical protein
MRLDLQDTVQAAKDRRATRRKRGRLAGVPLEHEEQASLIQWAFVMQKRIPELSMLFAIPNQGAARLKNLQTEGVMRGVPDLFLAVPRGRGDSGEMWHGLFIELKRRKGGKLSFEQVQWLNELTIQGYCAQAAYGWEEAKNQILKYLGKSE